MRRGDFIRCLEKALRRLVECSQHLAASTLALLLQLQRALMRVLLTLLVVWLMLSLPILPTQRFTLRFRRPHRGVCIWSPRVNTESGALP